MVKLILASQSPDRARLLKIIGFTPDLIIPANISEAPIADEKPRDLALRLAIEKAEKIASDYKSESIIIGADTVVSINRLPLPKALNSSDIRFCLNKLSGKKHQVHTGVCVIKTGDSPLKRIKVTSAKLKFKRLNLQEIEYYANLEEGLDKAGGYSIQGYAQSFIPFIQGEVSTIVGLPLYELRNILISLGIKTQ